MKPYAVITGASSGLGKSIALELAHRNINLVLIALPYSGLPELSDFIRTNIQVDVHYLELDLSDTKSTYQISDYVNNKKLHIKYLVNNAGVLSKGFFTDLSDRFILSQIAVNITTPTLLTKLLLDNLKASAPASILNISSMASFFALPKKQVYGATKAYLTSLSHSLNKELKRDNISVTAICPGGLNTTSWLCYQNRCMGWLIRKTILNPEDASRIAVNAMFKKEKLVVPGVVNRCLMFVDKILPDFIKDYLTNRELKKLNVSKT
ncbi:SDR family NAD(P)-dependent oxidoreductase [Seonamhaeicola aphaedonensis]|uniref:Short-subunit dehydrogenase n=1 Tax=Seonamhaeicola aphaedonensis TaxID=1461338 RepID=A0A3D9HLF7_9FLAO|nr:SDR family NAD(P)-dependent oxidoreductase [Seonamhaeicola aphaedonensis]RED50151.1 hypothetical protein DFQ02_101174 [Seonamhaeicola aphaedonensis]